MRKMLWFGLLMVASLVFFFTGYTEAEDETEEETKDLEHIDLPPVFEDLSEEVLKDFDFEDERQHFSLMNKGLKDAEEESILNMEKQQGQDISDNSVLDPNQPFSLEAEYLDTEDPSSVAKSHSVVTPNLYVGPGDSKGLQGASEDHIEFKVQDIQNEIEAHHQFIEEDAIFNMNKVADDTYGDQVIFKAHEPNYDVIPDDFASDQEFDENDLLVGEYVGRYIHDAHEFSVNNKWNEKRHTKITLDQVLNNVKYKALRRAELLRRRDEDKVERGDNPNRTNRVTLKRIQDHERLEEAHALLDDAGFVATLEYRKGDHNVHTHSSKDRFIKHDEF